MTYLAAYNILQQDGIPAKDCSALLYAHALGKKAGKSMSEIIIDMGIVIGLTPNEAEQARCLCLREVTS